MDNLRLAKIICPICGSSRNRLIFKKQGFNFVRCKICGLVFINPQPKLEVIKQVYQQYGKEYYLDKNKIEFDFNTSFEERLDLIELYRKNNRLLDVGCSIGAFLSAARSKGWDSSGVEISCASALYAKNVRNLNVFCGTLKEANYKDEYFDVVNIWAVLEHVQDPLEVVSEAYRILRKGGALVFCVPNFDCLPIRILGKRYRYICGGHLFYFTKASIVKLLNGFEFSAVKITSEYLSPLTFIEDLRGTVPNTLKTQRREREMMKIVKGGNGYSFMIRPFGKIFMSFIRNLYLGEEFRVLAVK